MPSPRAPCSGSAAYISSETPAFQYKTLIPCNLYGRYDTFDPRRSHLAAGRRSTSCTGQRSRGATTVDIWGDGTARREFLYAGDLADAILAAVERFDSLPPVLNIGAGVDHTVNEYYEAAAEVVGYRRQLHPRSVEAGRHEAQADGRQPRQGLGLGPPERR